MIAGRAGKAEEPKLGRADEARRNESDGRGKRDEGGNDEEVRRRPVLRSSLLRRVEGLRSEKDRHPLKTESLELGVGDVLQIMTIPENNNTLRMCRIYNKVREKERGTAMDTHNSCMTIKETLRRQLPLLKERYHILSLGIFGSYVRDDQHPESDLDLLVSFETTPGLLKFIELENYLSDLLGVKVDLVMQEALKKRIGERILQEVAPV